MQRIRFVNIRVKNIGLSNTCWCFLAQYFNLRYPASHARPLALALVGVAPVGGVSTILLAIPRAAPASAYVSIPASAYVSIPASACVSIPASACVSIPASACVSISASACVSRRACGWDTFPRLPFTFTIIFAIGLALFAIFRRRRTLLGTPSTAAFGGIISSTVSVSARVRTISTGLSWLGWVCSWTLWGSLPKEIS